MSLAYFPFYPSDYLSSATVQCMTLEQQGAYVRLLCYMWKTDSCSLPNDIEVLIRLIGDSERDLVGDVVNMSMTVIDDGKRITNERLLNEFNKAKEVYEKQVLGGKERAKAMWGKKKKNHRSPITSPSTSPIAISSPIANQNQNQNQKEIYIPKARHLEFVMLSDKEHEQLKEKLNGRADEYIARLNDYIGSKGAKYRSHYHTILNWWRKDVAEGKLTPVATVQEKPKPCSKCGARAAYRDGMCAPCLA